MLPERVDRTISYSGPRTNTDTALSTGSVAYAVSAGASQLTALVPFTMAGTNNSSLKMHWKSTDALRLVSSPSIVMRSEYPPSFGTATGLTD